MIEERLAELERLHAEVTPGPLRVGLDAAGLTCLRAPHQSTRTVARVFCEFDAEFIAAAWSAVPELIAEVRRLRALNESLAERVARQSELLSRKAERTD